MTVQGEVESPRSRVVDVRDLRIAFGPPGERTEVVHGIEFHVEAGESVAIVGESGSGKTVTARTLIGLTGSGATVTARGISVAGTDTMSLTPREWRALRGRSVGLVLQDALVSLDPLRRVGAEIAEAIALHRRTPRSDLRRQVVSLLADVGVPEPERRAAQYPHQLSGGLRQRALIASAIAADPELLIADEPTTALDVTVQAQILELLAQRKEAGNSMLLISHDLAVVSRIADRVYVMRYGDIVEQGPTVEVLESPQHPYTQALIAASPVEHDKGTRLAPGTAPPIARPPIGDEVVLSARDLTKSYPDGNRRRAVLHGVSFDLHRGETLGIVGESGSGKSTTARLVLALDDPDSGEVTLEGQPWSGLAERNRRARRPKIQVISQDPLSSFDPRFTVRRLIEEPLRRVSHPRGDRRRRSVELLGQVGLAEEFLERRPLALSGGQRQRVAIARALATRPDIIICDEAVSALDVSIQAQVLDLLADLQAEFGMSYLFISHHLGVVRHVSDRVLVMKDGDVVESGEVTRVFDHPQHDYTRELIAAIPRIGDSPRPEVAAGFEKEYAG